MDDIHDLHALLNIIDKLQGHPKMTALKAWAETKLQAHNDIIAKGGTSLAGESIDSGED